MACLLMLYGGSRRKRYFPKWLDPRSATTTPIQWTGSRWPVTASLNGILSLTTNSLSITCVFTQDPSQLTSILLNSTKQSYNLSPRPSSFTSRKAPNDTRSQNRRKHNREEHRGRQQEEEMEKSIHSSNDPDRTRSHPRPRGGIP